MNDQEKIISFIKEKGPVLPAQVAKQIESNILLASAHLSELSSQGKVKLSHLKIGGSPLYYLLEHKEKLQNFLHNFNPKDQQTLNLLKEKKILRESNLDLLTRVSLRKIKDFALPLNITLGDQKELFWKWYLVNDDEAIKLIKFQLTNSGFGKRESENVPLSSEENLTAKERPEKEFQPPPPSEKDKIDEGCDGLENQEDQTIQEKSNDLPSTEKKSPPLNKDENCSENQTSLAENQSLLQSSEDSKDLREDSQRKPLLQKLKEKLKPKSPGEQEGKKSPRRKDVIDEFSPKVESFFQEKNIKIEKKENLRKNSEIDFIINVPSSIGKVTYFCKAKNKKRCNEKDFSAAYLVAQSKKLPLLFIYSNEISKKAQEMIDSNTFENLIVKKLKENGT